MKHLKFILIGIVFGIILVKSEVISWFRIQEMFRFQAFHMYGVIGTAVLVGACSVFLIKKLKIKALDGSVINLDPKPFNKKGNIIGGTIFGLGWALTGACPGPLYALIGNGFGVISMALFSAVVGVWVYGKLKNKLPH